MIYLKEFDSHSSYESEVNVGVGISIPNVSYCKDANDVHFNPYNLIEFYVGDITGTPQTVKIYTDSSTSVDVTVSEGNKWYSYVLPKDKGLCKIKGDSVKKVVIKANMANYNVDNSGGLFPSSIIEASFKGSNTSNVTYMNYMFDGCYYLISLDVSSFDTSKVTTMDSMFQDCTSLTSLTLSNFNTSNVTNMNYMFYNCTNLGFLDLSGWDMSNVTDDMSCMFNGCKVLSKITMVGCSPSTINKIKAQLTTDGISIDKVNIITE